jgi:hypothetical protein
MGVLTPQQALANRIRADERNIENLSPMSSALTISCLTADCAVHFIWARKLDKELARDAENNLERVAQIYAERMMGPGGKL